MIFKATPAWSIITTKDGDNGYCIVKGSFPSTCWRRSLSLSQCGTICGRGSNCVGFTYASNSGSCHLYATDTTCPNGFEHQPRSTTAATKNDLVATSSAAWICYGKNSRKGILYLELYI